MSLNDSKAGRECSTRKNVYGEISSIYNNFEISTDLLALMQTDLINELKKLAAKNNVTKLTISWVKPDAAIVDKTERSLFPSQFLSQGTRKSIPHSLAGFKREMRFLEIARGGSRGGAGLT